MSAEVPSPDDPTTQLNTKLINTLSEADEIPVAGEAIDFCIASTLRDIIKNFKNLEYAKKIVLLTDAMSAVNAPGLEHLKDNFISEMKSLGVKFSTTKDYLA